MFDPNWPRWIYASVTKHFDSNINRPIKFEGTDTEQEKDFIEFRMDGPRVFGLAKDQFKLWIEISILVQTVIDDDFHKKYRIYGEVIDAFDTQIAINKWGDSGTLLDCLTRSGPVITTYFGEAGSETRIEQATIESMYEVFL